ncbi:exosome complex component RRP45-like isoform X2 [Daphnia pulex]|uniref:exosome complex component RRP45-like isoform X2 n=1 Tax=Daphnia pulex TaxID=6669 RepID=UPI001EDCA0AD|nr:exosome complex component RRP45-like isoform X2 [Daphnia pulex]
MKETPLSICEKQTVIQGVKEGQRVDGRSLSEQRKTCITFGTEWGCCQVLLGNTRVMAQVSCSVQVPKSSRANEGMLFINVEMSTMAAEHFEAGRLGQQGIEVNRLVERCIKDSRCIDLESLCILVEEQAWEVRVDIHVLNHEGNLIDAATLAALGALCHFKRPDVTLDGRDVIIHQLDERDPVPLTILHHPLTLSFALFNQGRICVLDPTNLEERSADGKLVMGLNAYRELCTLQISGDGVFIHKEAVISCANVAASRAVQMVEMLKKSLADDAAERAKGKYSGLVASVALETERITTQSQAEVYFKASHHKAEVSKKEPSAITKTKLVNDQGVVTLETSCDTSSSESEMEVEPLPPVAVKKRVYEEIDVGNDSEEEPVMLVTSELT